MFREEEIKWVIRIGSTHLNPPSGFAVLFLRYGGLFLYGTLSKVIGEGD